MFRNKLFLAGALALAVSVVSTPAFAQLESRSQLTYFTFSAPFELPGGTTLPAGKYVFKVLDSPSNRHIIQILSEDQEKVHTTLLAIPAQRMEPSDEPEVRFMEAPANTPPAIRTWWYPGRVIGHEFIYPKAHARRLASLQKEGVLTTAGDNADMKTADLARVEATGEETAYTEDATTAEATTAEARPTADTPPVAEPAQTPETTVADAPAQPAAAEPMTRQPQAQDTMAANTRTELPRTATPLPLVALLGLGSLVGAGALRLRR